MHLDERRHVDAAEEDERGDARERGEKEERAVHEARERLARDDRHPWNGNAHQRLERTPVPFAGDRPGDEDGNEEQPEQELHRGQGRNRSVHRGSAPARRFHEGRRGDVREDDVEAEEQDGAASPKESLELVKEEGAHG